MINGRGSELTSYLGIFELAVSCDGMLLDTKVSSTVVAIECKRVFLESTLMT